MKPIKLILICLLLTACATKTVHIPTKCPVPTLLPEEDYPISHLTQSDKADAPKVVKVYAGSLKQCVGALKSCRTYLGGAGHD